MTYLRSLMRSAFSSPGTIPLQYRRNFFLLYCDVAFWGILNGTNLTFLSIYAARQGATGTQVGLIGAIPALITLILALPTGNWLVKKPIHRSVVWTSIASRLFYLLLIPLPFIQSSGLQIWAIILITLVMTIPGTATVIGFQSMFGEVVPDEWRAHVAGIRNAALSIATTLAILLSGVALTSIQFPHGYVVVFGAGFVGAILSSVSLLLIKPLEGTVLPAQQEAEPIRIDDSPRSRKMTWLRLDILQGKFGRIIFLLFLFHLSQYLPIPIFPLYQVNFAKFSDQTISLGSAVFNMAVFLGSTQLERLTLKVGHRGVVGLGILVLGFYPAMMSQVREVVLLMVTSVVGGLGWAMVGGAIYNYILDSVPARGNPPYIALYNVALNAAILIGSMAGPLIAGQIGYVDALLIFGVARFLSGAAILKWG